MSEIRTARAFKCLDGSWRILYADVGGHRDERLPGFLDQPGTLPTVASLVEQMRADGLEPVRQPPSDETPATDARGYLLSFAAPKDVPAITKLMGTVNPPATPQGQAEKPTPAVEAQAKPKASPADDAAAARAALARNLRNVF